MVACSRCRSVGDPEVTLPFLLSAAVIVSDNDSYMQYATITWANAGWRNECGTMQGCREGWGWGGNENALRFPCSQVVIVVDMYALSSGRRPQAHVVGTRIMQVERSAVHKKRPLLPPPPPPPPPNQSLPLPAGPMSKKSPKASRRFVPAPLPSVPNVVDERADGRPRLPPTWRCRGPREL